MIKKRTKLISVLPDYLSYRLNEYIELSNEMDVNLIIGDSGVGFKEYKEKYHAAFRCKVSKVTKIWKFFYQSKTVKSYLFDNYDVFFIQANFRFLDFWLIILLNVLLNRNLLCHGQGLYRYDKPSLIRRLVYKYVVSSSKKYICYNSFSSNDLKSKIGMSERIDFVNNTIRFSSTTSLPRSKRYDGDLIFIGRLRKRSNVLELISAFESSHISLSRKLHIIGDGELLELCRDSSKSANVIFHGHISDECEISRISEPCSFGVYPGDAGLSLVHYAHLNLIPIFHSEYSSHMGPEFAYFLDIEEHVSFIRGNMDDAILRIENITEINFEYVSKSMSRCYQSIDEKSFGKAFKDVI
ncbi:hypothetical protein [Vibrio sp. M260118]|uniref:hypothetical protein n=1 Tax=Vibrio sp. M260118 TaxID=3020896 RepID=UPI002F41F796